MYKDAKLEAVLEEVLCQTQKETAFTLEEPEQTILHDLEPWRVT